MSDTAFCLLEWVGDGSDKTTLALIEKYLEKGCKAPVLQAK